MGNRTKFVYNPSFGGTEVIAPGILQLFESIKLSQ